MLQWSSGVTNGISGFNGNLDTIDTIRLPEHRRLLSRIHLPHRSCPSQARCISDSADLHCDMPDQVFEEGGRSRI
jgi:hypothetical protein